jgi:hypothetical protein
VIVRSCLVLLLALAGAAWGQSKARSEAPEALRAVHANRDRVKFVGTREVQVATDSGRTITTERVTRRGARWRFEPLDGARKGAVAVENGLTRFQYFPAENVIREVPPIEREVSLRLIRAFGQNRPGRVSVQQSDGGIVAGHPTKLVEAKAPGGRHLARAWIEARQGAVLKMEVFNPRGERAAYFEYTQIDFSATIPGNAFEIDRPGARRVTAEDDLVLNARRLKLPAYRLPDSGGWRLVQVRQLGQERVGILMQVYQSERNRVSLFVMRHPVNTERLRRLAGGAVNAHSFEIEDCQLVLIGDPPDEALRRLAATVKR